MSFPFTRELNPPRSGRVAATAIVWGCSTGMVAIALPLSNDAHSKAIIMIAIVTAAAVSTMTIWLAMWKSAQPDVEESNE